MFDLLSLHKVWKWLWFCEMKPQSSPRLCSPVKLRNTCRRRLTQRLLSWYSPVVSKVWVETETRAAKGQKWAAPRWCVLFYHTFQVKSTQIYFDTHFPCISNCCARPPGLHKIVYFNWGSTCRRVWEPLIYTIHNHGRWKGGRRGPWSNPRYWNLTFRY